MKSKIILLSLCCILASQDAYTAAARKQREAAAAAAASKGTTPVTPPTGPTGPTIPPTSTKPQETELERLRREVNEIKRNLQQEQANHATTQQALADAQTKGGGKMCLADKVAGKFSDADIAGAALELIRKSQVTPADRNSAGVQSVLNAANSGQQSNMLGRLGKPSKRYAH